MSDALQPDNVLESEDGQCKFDVVLGRQGMARREPATGAARTLPPRHAAEKQWWRSCRAVIALPEKMFQGTPVAGAMLVMRRQRSSREVLFIDARGCGRGQEYVFAPGHRVAETCPQAGAGIAASGASRAWLFW